MELFINGTLNEDFCHKITEVAVNFIYPDLQEIWLNESAHGEKFYVSEEARIALLVAYRDLLPEIIYIKLYDEYKFYIRIRLKKDYKTPILCINGTLLVDESAENEELDELASSHGVMPVLLSKAEFFYEEDNRYRHLNRRPSSHGHNRPPNHYGNTRDNRSYDDRGYDDRRSYSTNLETHSRVNEEDDAPRDDFYDSRSSSERKSYSGSHFGMSKRERESYYENEETKTPVHDTREELEES